MTDIDERDRKKQSEGKQPRRLELKKTVETGQVRQSFAHGRSKMVTVEVRKKRTFAPEARGRAVDGARGHQREGGPGEGGSPRPETKARDGSAVGLTNAEKATRVRALQDAMKAEEDRHLAPPSTVPAEESYLEEAIEQQDADTAAAEALPPETPTIPQDADNTPLGVPGEATEESAPEPVTPIVPIVEKAEPATAPAQPPHDESAPVLGEGAPEQNREAATQPAAESAAATKPATAEADSDARGKPKRPARVEVRKVDPGRRDDAAGRRSGKINITDVLDDAAGERMRSLASVRRAREKERLKQISQRMENQKVVRDVIIPESLTVQELANRMAERSTDVIKALMRMGVMATINHTIDADTAELLAVEFGHNVRRVTAADVEIGLRGEEDAASDLVRRPPVVTVMGHVDHGKTTLLDKIRNANVVAGEAGGITQHIGAYKVDVDGRQITFLDTPGHAAFTQMRARGAQVTDIVVLMVAADDGVMPQTIEAINHAKAAEVPIVVALNKIDKENADPQRVLAELSEHGLVAESWGGDTIVVEMAAQQNLGVDDLLEQLAAVAEIEELTANPTGRAKGVVLEANLDIGRGPVATILVDKGELKVGDPIVAGAAWGRVRAMINDRGEQVKTAGPSTPVQVLGLQSVPNAGDEFRSSETEKTARTVAEAREQRQRLKAQRGDARVQKGVKLEDIFSQIQAGEVATLNLVLKADVQGSLEAVTESLRRLERDEVKLAFVHRAVGAITENDISLAATTNATLIGFNVRPDRKAREMAGSEGVEIRTYEIIYKLLEDIERAMVGMLAPEFEEVVTGEAEVREVFRVPRVGGIAGCMVLSGTITRGSKVRFLRDGTIIWKGAIQSLKRFKEDAREVREGFECGIGLTDFQDLKQGDIIETYEEREIARV